MNCCWSAWLPLAWSLRREAGLWRLQLVVAGTVVIALIGVLIDQAAVIEMNLSGKSAIEFEQGVAGLLRYYWYRMSDSLLPVGMALGIVWWLAHLQVTRPAVGNWLLMAAILLSLANLADVGYWRLASAVARRDPAAAADDRFDRPLVVLTAASRKFAGDNRRRLGQRLASSLRLG